MNEPKRPHPFLSIAVILCLLAALIITSLLTGCRTVEYSTPEGRTLRVSSVLTTPEIGKLQATTPEGGSVTLEGYRSDSQAASEALGKLADKLP